MHVVNTSFFPQTGVFTAYIILYSFEVGTEVLYNLDERHFVTILTDTCQLIQLQFMEFRFKYKAKIKEEKLMFFKNAPNFPWVMKVQ
jgi:hypothetical protein